MHSTKLLYPIFAVVVIAALGPLSFAQPPANLPSVVPGSFIVQLEEDADVDLIADLATRLTGGQVGHIYKTAVRGFSIHIPPVVSVEELRSFKGVKNVEPDLIMYAFGQTIPTGVDRINADDFLNIAEKDVTIDVDVAIIDTGIDSDHPDLNVIGGVNCISTLVGPPKSRSSYEDDNGHGTHVAGTVAAMDNAFGVVGVAPGARLWAVKVLNRNGSGSLSDIIKGIDWVTGKADEIEVANMSLGGQGVSDAFRTAIQYSVAKGVVYVVAAGNESMDVYGPDGDFNTYDDIIPAAYPEVAAISAMVDTDGKPGGEGSPSSYGPDDSFASFSNYSASVVDGNPVTSTGKAIDLILPGVNIVSTYLNGGYATGSGTSMASPHAAGLAALYIAQNGRAGNADGVYVIRQALIDGGIKKDDEYGRYLIENSNDPDSNPENLGWVGSFVVPTPTPNPTPTPILETMHVGNLEGAAIIVNARKWKAQVTVTIHGSCGDECEVSVSGATVSGLWSGAYSGTVSGITGSDGTVTFTTGNINGGSSVTFTVNHVSHDTLTYAPDQNSESTITITK